MTPVRERETTRDTAPLNAGDRLTRPEFERRYRAHPEIRKAELIEGVVYMPPFPLHHAAHGRPHASIIALLGQYVAGTPGVDLGDNSTVIIDMENEVQPDAFLRLEASRGGQSRVNEADFLEGVPELIIEIAASSAAYDMHQKKRLYARSGVQEYVVVQMYERRIDWFVLREGTYENLPAGGDQIFRSEQFPGLWFDQEAFWQSDLARLLATGQRGLSTPEHQEFSKT